MAIPKATPTEYKGIVYRSKSEAMFARYLELEAEEYLSIDNFHSRSLNVGDSAGAYGFVYEPKYLTVDGWVPDFLRWAVGGGRHLPPYTLLTVIEYKPCRPTLTYAARFAKRCSVLHRREGMTDASFELYFGSVYNTDWGVFYWSEDDGLVLDDQSGDGGMGDWLINFSDAIRETRFDLEAQ